MLKEHATHFYLEDKCNCAEAVVLAANAEYNLGLSDDVCKLVGGFGAGVSCGSTCGALLGEKNLVRLAIASVIIALVLYMIFSGLRSVNLPRGTIGFLRNFALFLESIVAGVKGIFG